MRELLTVKANVDRLMGHEEQRDENEQEHAELIEKLKEKIK